MKTTRTYLSGCIWCNATGFVNNPISGGVSHTELTITCPVCNGGKTVIITETIEDSNLLKEKELNEIFEKAKNFKDD